MSIDWIGSRTRPRVAASGALHFAGATNDAVELANAAFAPTASGFTIAFWFRVTADVTASLVSLQAAANPAWSARYAAGPTTAMFFQVINNGSTPVNSPNRSISLNTWEFFVGANANTGVDVNNLIYDSLNGEAKQTTTHSTAGPMSTGTNKLAIGYEVLTANRYATIDIARIGYWNKVLSDGEITTLYNGGVSKRYADLSGSLLTSLGGYWNGEDTGGQNVADSSGGGLTLAGKNGTSTYTSVAGPP